ncbi:EAL domain-containing protein [Halomonas sp. LBP4]|uniref:EAL domain-containing protein n=1 Tax=Halomonas sp. LBP4 TaxID=2044917 RepID=UPI000D7545D7|nr:EAL domain-containing protein [Halomonas sp. LBP4]PXX95834.1 hypothetical protein CR157_16670 [Halomonas sp. LBP4]
MTSSLLALQPIVCGKTRSHRAYEALARFPGPNGLRGPYDALRDGQWAALDREMLKHLRDWTRLGNRRNSPLFINLSAETLANDDDFEAWLEDFDAFQAADQTPVTLEVSEFVDDDLLDRRWPKLAALSHGIALDDFGARFASLDRLKGYPWAICKFECASLDAPATQEAMTFCRRRGIQQVVERIESSNDAARASGVDLHQGYHYGRPQAVAIDYNVRKVGEA